MEALNLLKYWKTNSSTTEAVKLSGETSNNTTTTETTAIVSAAVENETELEDDGPFFDLKLPVAKQNADELVNDEHDDIKPSESDEKESKATFTSSNGDAASSVPEQQQETSKAQFHESVLKSATKLRVFMLGSSNKSKPKSTDETTRDDSEAKSTKKMEHESKLFTVMKFRAEDVPFVSLFTRDTSKSASNNNTNRKSLKQNMTDSESDDKNGFSTEVVHNYLKKKVKPLYVRVSKPSGGGVKLGLNTRAKLTSVVKVKAEAETEAGRAISNVKSLASGLRNVRKHNSTKRGTALAAVAAAPTVVVSTRRDDSLLQQQDGIQSAILHCKRSFNDDSRST